MAAPIGMKNIRFLGDVTVFGRLTIWGGNVEFASRRGSATPASVMFRGEAHIEGGELSGGFWENEGSELTRSATRLPPTTP